MPTQSLPGAVDALAAALAADTELSTWCTSHFARGLTVKKAFAYGPLETAQLPGVLLLPASLGGEIIVIGGKVATLSADLEGYILWSETTDANAFAESIEIPEIFVRMMLRNRTLSDTVGSAALASFDLLEENESLYGARFVIHLEWEARVA